MVSGSNHFSSSCRSLGSKLIAKSTLIERWRGWCTGHDPTRAFKGVPRIWAAKKKLARWVLASHISFRTIVCPSKRRGCFACWEAHRAPWIDKWRCMGLSFARRTDVRRRQCRFAPPNLGIVLRALTGVMPTICREPPNLAPLGPPGFYHQSRYRAEGQIMVNLGRPGQLVPSSCNAKARS